MSKQESGFGPHVLSNEYIARKRIEATLGRLPILRREVVNPENLQHMRDKLAEGVGDLVIATHPGMSELPGIYSLYFSDSRLSVYRMAMGQAKHQSGRLTDFLARRTGVKFLKITTPETVRKYDRSQRKLFTKVKNRVFGNRPKPQLYEGMAELTSTSEKFLREGAIVTLFPQGTRSPQLESVDDMKALSRFALIAHGRHNLRFAITFIGIDMVGVKSKSEYEKLSGLRSFTKKMRYTIGPTVEIDDALADPDVNRDYRKLDYFVKRELSKLVDNAYRGDFSIQ